MTAPPDRHRLPNRRRAETQELALGGAVLTATVGFDTAGRPAEVFLSGAKDGSGMAAILEDASVVISIALQHGISARLLTKSIARLPVIPPAPPYLDHPLGARPAASAIGSALDLIVEYEVKPG
jgi:hypothetical protein